ncbi:MAG: hypothetical protein PWQ54_764 [Bacteroidales bacterium]|jgi:hypothetical protein|nr:hypothetical protein [Bacteroidales bacterium]
MKNTTAHTIGLEPKILKVAVKSKQKEHGIKTSLTNNFLCHTHDKNNNDNHHSLLFSNTNKKIIYFV